MVSLERLSSGVYQTQLSCYYLVNVSMAVAWRMFCLPHYCFWACDKCVAALMRLAGLATLTQHPSLFIWKRLKVIHNKKWYIVRAVDNASLYIVYESSWKSPLSSQPTSFRLHKLCGLCVYNWNVVCRWVLNIHIFKQDVDLRYVLIDLQFHLFSEFVLVLSEWTIPL